ncbi:MAG: iron-sulfur cluster assembly scaffold protein [Anaerolineae bacterium]
MGLTCCLWWPFCCLDLFFSHHVTGCWLACTPGDGWSGSVRLAYSGQPYKRDWSAFSDSIATERIKGKSLDEAVMLSNKALTEALGGLLAQEQHCSNLAADAVRAAMEDYWSRRKGTKAEGEQPEG